MINSEVVHNNKTYLFDMFSCCEQLQFLFHSSFIIAAYVFKSKKNVRKINQNNFETFAVEVNFFVNLFTTVGCLFIIVFKGFSMESDQNFSIYFSEKDLVLVAMVSPILYLRNIYHM